MPLTDNELTAISNLFEASFETLPPNEQSLLRKATPQEMALAFENARKRREKELIKDSVSGHLEVKVDGWDELLAFANNLPSTDDNIRALLTDFKAAMLAHDEATFVATGVASAILALKRFGV